MLGMLDAKTGCKYRCKVRQYQEPLREEGAVRCSGEDLQEQLHEPGSHLRLSTFNARG